VSGLSAAHTVYLAGGNVVVLDKQGFFGGNSTKATSGINGALTRTQVEHGIQDSVKQFYDDTLKSARDKARPDLIKVLTYKSAAAVEWLQDVFNLDLTLVSRLGYVFSLFFPSFFFFFSFLRSHLLERLELAANGRQSPVDSR
jgi:succinate dehydrogenase/fumarate reductase flavoprotein subunit